jgi:endonuclease III
VSRLERQIDALARFYGLLPTPPHDPFALFVWEVLSAQAPTGRRDAAFAALKRARALTPDALWRTPPATLEAAVALAGAYREQRLQALSAAASLFRRRPRLSLAIAGPLPAARRALALLPQLGDAAAHRMLLYTGHRCVLPVDGRVHRVACRLGYAAAPFGARGAAARTRRALSCELPRDPERIRRAAIYLTHHAGATCTESEPHCAVCPLLAECPEGTRRAAPR